jgi:hypothetical protein
MSSRKLPNDEAAILGRVIRADDDLSPTAARALLKLSFPPADRDRMHELAVRNQDGSLTPAESRELDSYRRVGRLLDLLAARARRSLARRVRG